MSDGGVVVTSERLNPVTWTGVNGIFMAFTETRGLGGREFVGKKMGFVIGGVGLYDILA